MVSFSIKWEYLCHECSCPMHIKLVTRDEDVSLFLRDFGSWAYLKPFSLARNTWYYKFYGLSLKRVCVSCFFRPKRFNVMEREHGIKKVGRPDFAPRSKTFREVYEYFEDFVAFRNRRDLDACIVKKSKRRDIVGMNLFWRPPFISS
jgi:hypothetical protein